MTALRPLLVFVAALCLSAPVGNALELIFPVGAEITTERSSAFDTFQAPIGPFDGVSVPKLDVEGAILRRAWRISERDLTPVQIMVPLREQLEVQGFDIALECAAKDCGGFDFRFDIEVLPGPNMFVDLSRYRYLTAFRGDREDPEEAMGILVSITTEAAYLQVIEARAEHLPVPVAAVPASNGPGPFFQEADAVAEAADLGEDLILSGRVILHGLEFASGTADLSEGSYPSLDGLARFLSERPDVRIALVGHTDTVGGLEPNIALSRARAASVRSMLVENYGVAVGRIDAEGMGYLAPIASNLTEEGRDRNRRVEAVLLTE